MNMIGGNLEVSLLGLDWCNYLFYMLKEIYANFTEIKEIWLRETLKYPRYALIDASATSFNFPSQSEFEILGGDFKQEIWWKTWEHESKSFMGETSKEKI